MVIWKGCSNLALRYRINPLNSRVGNPMVTTFKGRVRNRSRGRSTISRAVNIRGRRNREIHQSGSLVSIRKPGRMDVTSNRANPVTIQTRT